MRLSGRHAASGNRQAPVTGTTRSDDEVKADAAALRAKLLRLYEGGAHTALGYSSWGMYCADEFDTGKSRAYQVLDAARVVEVLPKSTIVERPAREAVARELVPIFKNEPERVQEVWAEVIEKHGPAPTAAQPVP